MRMIVRLLVIRMRIDREDGVLYYNLLLNMPERGLRFINPCVCVCVCVLRVIQRRMVNTILSDGVDSIYDPHKH